MRRIFYFGRKNHYGLRQTKNTKNMCDCVSGYLMRYYNVDTKERLGSSPNIFVEKNYKHKNSVVRTRKNENYIMHLRRLECAYQEGSIIMTTNEPLIGVEVDEEGYVSIDDTLRINVEYNALFHKAANSTDQYDGKLQLSDEDFPNVDYSSSDPELNISFNSSTIGELKRIPNRADYMTSDLFNDDVSLVQKDLSKIKVTMLTAFKFKIDFTILTKMLYYEVVNTFGTLIPPTLQYKHKTLEKCDAKSFYFVIEGKTMRREKIKFRFTLDSNGNLIEPTADFHPISELKLAENPFLTADAVYQAEGGDIPLYQWVAKNYLTKYKRIRKELEFEKALTPLYLTRDFKTEAEYRLDRPIRNGDYISITDEFGSWMGGTLGDRLEQSFFDYIKNKYNDEAKANEIKAHPLIYRVMNVNTKMKNDVGFQKCECLEVVDLKEIEEIFI